MRYLIISDIHGSITALDAVLPYFDSLRCDYIVSLGDILYHGPRNPLPDGHNPKAVAERLNEYASRMIAVRGNCDSEVDQMVLQFPCLPDYMPLFDNGVTLFLSHGHLYSPHFMPPLHGVSLFLYGHTHLWELARHESGVWICNPGSIALPKDGHPATFAVYDNGLVMIYALDGEILQVADVVNGNHLLQRAIEIATNAHKGQTDRAGKPYITHPLRVMQACSVDDERIVAVLHDVVEDTPVTLDDLSRDFPPHIVEAVGCLTRTPEMAYEQYIEQVADNPLAVQVKLRDLSDNMDIRRLLVLTDADQNRLHRYLKAYKRLSLLASSRA